LRNGIKEDLYLSSFGSSAIYSTTSPATSSILGSIVSSCDFGRPASTTPNQLLQHVCRHRVSRFLPYSCVRLRLWSIVRTDLPSLVVVALMFLVLTTISTPVAKDLYFLQVQTTGNLSSPASTLRLGTLGYCVLGGESSTLSFVTNGTLANGCTARKLGYTLDSSLFTDGNVLGVNVADLGNSVVKGLTYLLVLQPIGTSASHPSCYR
jgi:hypothetical protein